MFLQTKSFKVELEPLHILSYQEFFFFTLFWGSEVPSNTLEMRDAASRKLSLFFFILHLLSFSQLGLGKRSSKGLEKQEEAQGKWEVVEEDASIIGSREVETKNWKKQKSEVKKRNSSSGSSEIWKATNSFTHLA